MSRWLAHLTALPIGLAVALAEAAERLPKTFVLRDGRRLRRGMTRAEVEALLGAGEADATNATRKIAIERWRYGAVTATYKRGRLTRLDG
jgi:hypothetical protein